MSQIQLGKRQKARQGDIFGGDNVKSVLTSPGPLATKPGLSVAAPLAPVTEKRKKRKKSKKSSKPSEGGLVAY